MGAIDRLYNVNNKTIKKSVNLDDSLYHRLINFNNKNYDATFSEIVNICIEEYIEKNNPTFFPRPDNETVTYRGIMIRKENLKNLQNMCKKTGISVTRLLNCAIKEFLEKYDK